MFSENLRGCVVFLIEVLCGIRIYFFFGFGMLLWVGCVWVLRVWSLNCCFGLCRVWVVLGFWWLVCLLWCVWCVEVWCFFGLWFVWCCWVCFCFWCWRSGVWFGFWCGVCFCLWKFVMCFSFWFWFVWVVWLDLSRLLLSFCVVFLYWEYLVLF